MSDLTLRKLVYGQGAPVDSVACVEDIGPELAARLGWGSPHSIWETVLPTHYWMDYERCKIAGENGLDKAIESWPPHAEAANESSWQGARRHIVHDLRRLPSPAESDSTTFGRIVQDIGQQKTSRQSTVRGTLWRITPHNSYHLGQIALLRRQAGAWPPERGGDTW